MENIAISRIKVPKRWRMRELNMEYVKELVVSIVAVGIVEPIIVRKTGGGYPPEYLTPSAGWRADHSGDHQAAR